MRNQFANRISFFEPPGAGLPDPFLQPRRPAVLVGIQRDVTPPFFFSGGRLQRMRVIVVTPGETDQLVDLDGNGPDDGMMAEVLPPLTAPLAPAQQFRLKPRLVQGEILRGEEGTLYERLGLRIRPLRRLVSGPNGEILEVTESGETSRFLPRRGLQIEREEVGSDEAESPDIEVESDVEPSPTPKGRTPETPRQNAPSFRPLFPEPGQWRVVRLGDFKTVLSPQLAHADRLRDTHRLPCHVQVYEAIAPVRLEALVAAVDGDSAGAPRVQPLTRTLALQLGLTPLLPPPRRAAHSPAPHPGLLLAGERAVRLQVAFDPTLDEPAPAAQSTPAPAAADGTTAPAPQAPAQPNGAAVPALKTGIPERFLKPWEFRMSREEAMYELNASNSLMGTLAGALRRTFGFRRELRKWQVFLTGKSPEEQLWTVRPPRGGTRHPFIREWAERTLQLAGYDARPMLAEWELFWRRKGS